MTKTMYLQLISTKSLLLISLPFINDEKNKKLHEKEVELKW